MGDRISGTTDGVSLRRQTMGAGSEPFVDETQLKEMREEIQFVYSYGSVILLYYKYAGQGDISPQDELGPNYDPFSENNLTYNEPVEIRGYFEVDVSNEELTAIGSDELVSVLIHLNKDDMSDLSVVPSTDDLIALTDQGTDVNNDFIKYVGVKLKIAGVDPSSEWRSTAHWLNINAMPLDVNFSNSTPVPAIDFTGDTLTGFAPLSVTFTPTNTGGAITTYAWDFGDGETSTAQSPTHEYSDSGDYTVTLEVTGVGGFDSKVRTDYIAVS